MTWWDESSDFQSDMIGFILYCGAVFVAMLLFMFYRPAETEKETVTDPRFSANRRRKNEFALRGLLARMGLNPNAALNNKPFESFTEHFKSFEEVASACKRAGLEKCNLVIGVDFTASNEWQGRKTFNQNCLHKTSGNRIFNPYQRVIWIMAQTLASFDEDNLIPCFGFGDSTTTDENVFTFREDSQPCNGFQEVLYYYNQIVPKIALSGPTSFAPVIKAAIDIVKEENSYHILVIIADGQVNEEQPTIDAIIEASHYPLSIIVIGVGDGPWCVMEEFDHRLPKRKFDNFRFVDYHKATSKAKNADTAFALQALMEIPDQYKTMKYLGYIEETNEEQTTTTANNQNSNQNNHHANSTPNKTPPQLPTHPLKTNSHPLLQKRGSNSSFKRKTMPFISEEEDKRQSSTLPQFADRKKIVALRLQV